MTKKAVLAGGHWHKNRSWASLTPAGPVGPVAPVGPAGPVAPVSQGCGQGRNGGNHPHPSLPSDASYAPHLFLPSTYLNKETLSFFDKEFFHESLLPFRQHSPAL